MTLPPKVNGQAHQNRPYLKKNEDLSSNYPKRTFCHDKQNREIM